MVNPDIRKLQVLNDLISQTLDVITQRGSFTGGLSHSPFTDINNPWNNPYGFNQPQNIGLGHSPYQNPFQQIGFNTPQNIGLGHTPYQQLGMGMGMTPNVFPNVFGQQNPFGFGLSHTPFNNPFHNVGYWNNPINHMGMMGGLSHSPIGWQSHHPQHTGIGFQNPWMNPGIGYW
jgi:hypothetical protein